MTFQGLSRVIWGNWFYLSILFFIKKTLTHSVFLYCYREQTTWCMWNTEQTVKCPPKENKYNYAGLHRVSLYHCWSLLLQHLFTQDKGTGKFIQNTVGISEATGRFQGGLSFSSCHLLWTGGFVFCQAIRAHGNWARDLLRQVARAPCHLIYRWHAWFEHLCPNTG